MTLSICIQHAIDSDEIPADEKFEAWAKAAYAQVSDKLASEITIRIVDHEEGTFLNETYRSKKGPTNVLSFPANFCVDVPHDVLGDIVICLPVVKKEANEYHKSLEQHIAHLTVHGVLHLLGYDHEIQQDANIMESIEIQVLKKLGFPNPYQHKDQ